MIPVFLSLFLGTVLMSAGDAPTAPAPAEQSAEAAAAEPSGVATVVEIQGEARAYSKSTGVERVLKQGDAVYLDEMVSTGEKASLQIEVADESLFTISENTTVRMDLFDLDENKQDGHFTASVTKGVFRFVSGKVAKLKPENVNIEVPSGTIGIRGTVVLGEIEGEKCLVSLEAEEGEKTQHRIVFSSNVGGQMQQVEITKPGFATVIEGRGLAPKPAFELPQENRARFQEKLPAPRFLPRDSEGRPQMSPNVRDPRKFPGPMQKKEDAQKNSGGPNPPGGPGGPGGNFPGPKGPNEGPRNPGGQGRDSLSEGNRAAGFQPGMNRERRPAEFSGNPARGRENFRAQGPQAPGQLKNPGNFPSPGGRLRAGGPAPSQKPQGSGPRNQKRRSLPSAENKK